MGVEWTDGVQTGTLHHGDGHAGHARRQRTDHDVARIALDTLRTNNCMVPTPGWPAMGRAEKLSFAVSATDIMWPCPSRACRHHQQIASRLAQRCG